jgi:2-oxoglutarate ferredoxin oxidoreductase subunit alpha
MGGNVAIAEGAILAGCRAYFGYPITPQNEILEHLAKRLPEMGRVFVQTESELAAINMVFGAGAAGVRAMTSTSSPGFSLQQEGISYMAGAEVPGVIVNVMRGGPGLGNIGGAQGDYFQAVKGGGHGDYRIINLAPASVQAVSTLPAKPWAITGAKGRAKNLVNSFEMDPANFPPRVKRLLDKYEEMRLSEVRYEDLLLGDAEIAVVSYGSASRSAISAVNLARLEGIKAGLFRPITLFPFPEKPLKELSGKIKKYLVAELSSGQMIDDVRLAVGPGCKVDLVNRYGGVPLPAEEILEALRRIA